MDLETKEHMHLLGLRIQKLEDKVDQLLTVLEQGTGAWMLLRWLGGIVLGIAALFSFFKDHFK